MSDRALVLRSADYGSSSQLRFSIRYAVVPEQDDFIIAHTTDFLNDKPRVNLIATLPSDAIIAGGTLGSGTYSITPTLSGTLYDWRISATNLNSGGEYVAGNVLNIYGNSSVAESYEIISSLSYAGAAVATTTLLGSNIVTVTDPAHGLETGDIVSVSTTTSIGGITALQLSVTDATITKISASVYTYLAPVNATSTDAGTLDAVTSGAVTVKAPGAGGLSPITTFDAAVAPIRTYETVDKTWEDLATAINAYLTANPVASAEAIGTDFATNPILKPTYNVYPSVSAYAGDDMSGAFSHHSFECKYSGSAGIFEYDSSVPTANAIKATVQTDESIFPLASEATGTSYSPVGELVQIVPTNSKSMAAWTNFTAITSLSLLADIDRAGDDEVIQISSKEDGGDGAVAVTGVSSNGVDATIIGNSSDIDESIRSVILNSAARSLISGQLVKLDNAIPAEILREYRDVPTGSSITVANTETTTTYFRPENAIKYVRVNQTTGRLIFLRNGKGPLQTEPLASGNDITLTDLGSGLVQVTSAIAAGPVGTGLLSARVGDMMYVSANIPHSPLM